MVPAVEVIKISGCSRAVTPSAMMSYRARPLFHWWISSIMAPWMFRPSSVSLSEASGLKTPSLKSLSSSATRLRIRRQSAGDFLTIRFASCQMIFAWSRLVATA